MLLPSSIPWLGLALPLTSAAIFAKPRGQGFQERGPMWIRQASNSTILGSGTGVSTGTGTGAGTTIASVDPGLASTTSCTSISTVTDLVTSILVESFGPSTTVLVSGGDDCHECETTITDTFVETLTEGYAPGATIILTPEAPPASGQGAPTVSVQPVPTYGGSVPTPIVTTLTIVPAGPPAYSAIIPGESSPVVEVTESSAVIPIAATPTPTPIVTVVTIPAYGSASAVPAQPWSTELVVPPSTTVTCSAGSPVTSSGGFYGTTYIVTPAVCETLTLPGTTFTVTPTGTGTITLPGTTFTITQETIVVPPASPATPISTPSVVMVPGLGETTFGVPVFGGSPVPETPIATVTVVIGTITPTPITTVLPSVPVYTGPAGSEASPISIAPVSVVTITVTEGAPVATPAVTQPATPEESCVTITLSGTPVTVTLPATGGVVTLPAQSATVPAYVPSGGAGSPPAQSNASAVGVPGSAQIPASAPPAGVPPPAYGQTVPETPIATTTITLPAAGPSAPSFTVLTLGGASSGEIPATAPGLTVPGNPASAPPFGGAPGALQSVSTAGPSGIPINSPGGPLPTGPIPPNTASASAVPASAPAGGAPESQGPAPSSPVSAGLPGSPNSPVGQTPIITTVTIPVSAGVPEAVTTVTVPAPTGPVASAGTPGSGSNSQPANAGEIPTVITLTETPSGAVPTVQVSGNAVIPAASGSASPIVIVSTLTAVPIPASPEAGSSSASTILFAGPGEVVSAPAGSAAESAIVTVITNTPNPATETPEVVQITIPAGVSVLTATITATPYAPEITTVTIPAPAASPAGGAPAYGSAAGNGTAPASGTGLPSSSGTTGSGSGSEGGSEGGSAGSGTGSGSGSGTYGNSTAPAAGNGGSSGSGASGSAPPAPPAAGSPNGPAAPSSASGPIAASSGSRYGASAAISAFAILAALFML